MNNQTNYTMLCDFYELSMANGYFQTPLKDCITYFDVFFRTIPAVKAVSPSPQVWNRW